MNFPIVFYDGECGFCNRSVQFILDHERNTTIHFCAIQSETATRFFREHNFATPDLTTFYFWDGTQLFERSTAGLKLTKHLKIPYSWFRFFLFVPQFFRDGIYNWIAKRRHRLARHQCVLPSIEQRERFLI